MYRLGLCYLNGTGVAANRDEAARYLKLAADQGHADAQRVHAEQFTPKKSIFGMFKKR